MFLTPMSHSTQPSVPRSRNAVTIYLHVELFHTISALIEARKKKKGYKGPRSASQFFEREAVRLLREEGRKHGLKLPDDI